MENYEEEAEGWDENSDDEPIFDKQPSESSRIKAKDYVTWSSDDIEK